ncbi:hypothetical protein LguiA_019561 [Lonicera macranthoides]
MPTHGVLHGSEDKFQPRLGSNMPFVFESCVRKLSSVSLTSMLCEFVVYKRKESEVKRTQMGI